MILNRQLFLFTGFLVFVGTSCKIASSATTRNECIACLALDEQNLNQLNGKYSRDLWKYIAPLKKGHTIMGLYVRLTVVNNKEINAHLIIDDSAIVATKKIKGIIKDGYFSVNTKVYAIGVPFIYFDYYSNKIDFTLTNKNELNMTIEESKLFWVFIMSAGETRDFNMAFKKL